MLIDSSAEPGYNLIVKFDKPARSARSLVIFSFLHWAGQVKQAQLKIEKVNIEAESPVCTGLFAIMVTSHNSDIYSSKNIFRSMLTTLSEHGILMSGSKHAQSARSEHMFSVKYGGDHFYGG